MEDEICETEAQEDFSAQGVVQLRAAEPRPVMTVREAQMEVTREVRAE